MDSVIAGIRLRFTDDELCIYIRGSVVLGCAVKGISDIDLVVLLDDQSSLNSEDLDDWLMGFVLEHHIECPVDLHTVKRSTLSADKAARLTMVLATQSLCLFGTDTADATNYKPGQTMFLDTPWLREDIEAFAERIQVGEVTAADVSQICKVLITVAFELVMASAGKYTRSLSLSVDCFGVFYPAKYAMAKQLLQYFLNPEGVTSPNCQAMITFGDWLIGEVTKASS
jgi:hypothetical protein